MHTATDGRNGLFAPLLSRLRFAAIRDDSQRFVAFRGDLLISDTRDLWWFAVVCGGLRWFVVVCGGLWWFAVICGGLSFSHTDIMCTGSLEYHPAFL